MRCRNCAFVSWRCRRQPEAKCGVAPGAALCSQGCGPVEPRVKPSVAPGVAGGRESEREGVAAPEAKHLHIYEPRSWRRRDSLAAALRPHPPMSMMPPALPPLSVPYHAHYSRYSTFPAHGYAMPLIFRPCQGTYADPHPRSDISPKAAHDP